MAVGFQLVIDCADPDRLARFRQIAAILRERIEAGELEPNRPIHSETAIEQEFGVARATARRAVAVLPPRHVGAEGSRLTVCQFDIN